MSLLMKNYSELSKNNPIIAKRIIMTFGLNPYFKKSIMQYYDFIDFEKILINNSANFETKLNFMISVFF